MGQLYHPLRRQQEDHQAHVTNGKKEKAEYPVSGEIFSCIIEMDQKNNGYEAYINDIQEIPRIHEAMKMSIKTSKRVKKLKQFTFFSNPK
jgi:hypothetical protein